MPVNDFLPIAAAGGANVEDQADYAADADRTAFFPDGGIPDAAQHGKMFRQCSAVAVMMAQAICDITGLDMLDDGNLATQLASLKTMLQELGTLVYANDTGAANAYVIAPSPAVPALKKGMQFWFNPAHTNTGASTVNVSGIGAKSIVHIDNTALLPGDIPANGLAQIVYQPTLDKFVLMSSSPAVPYSTSGYTKFPGTPFIVQWVGYSLASLPNTINTLAGTIWGQQAVVWPITFPSGSIGSALVSPVTQTNGNFTFASAEFASSTGTEVYVTATSAATLPVTGIVVVFGF